MSVVGTNPRPGAGDPLRALWPLLGPGPGTRRPEGYQGQDEGKSTCKLMRLEMCRQDHSRTAVSSNRNTVGAVILARSRRK